MVPERRGSSREFPSGSQTLSHPINTTGLCLHLPALGKRPSLRLSALVLAGASTGTRMGLQGRAEDGWQMEKWARVDAAPAMERLQRGEGRIGFTLSDIQTVDGWGGRGIKKGVFRKN